MGTLRTLLAITVVLHHAYGFVFVGGRNAVQLFYVISGFLISYVLVERRSYASKRTFYLNRYLRLWPMYAVVALATLVLLVFEPGSLFWTAYRDSPPAARILLTVSNAVLFGQDWVMFAGVRDAHLTVVRHFSWSDPVLWPGLLVPQAWTLGVELTFYLVAPFLLPRRRWMLALLALSLALRGSLIALGIGLEDPWTYRFFPTELALFLFGALAHQWLRPLYACAPAAALRRWASVATIGAVIVVVGYAMVPASEAVKTVALIAFFVPVVPLLFAFQRGRAWDRWVGDLSYPIYIVHYLVIWLVEAAGVTDKPMLAVASTVGSILLAIALEHGVGAPLERVRAGIKARAPVAATV